MHFGVITEPRKRDWSDVKCNVMHAGGQNTVNVVQFLLNEMSENWSRCARFHVIIFYFYYGTFKHHKHPTVRALIANCEFSNPNFLIPLYPSPRGFKSWKYVHECPQDVFQRGAMRGSEGRRSPSEVQVHSPGWRHFFRIMPKYFV